MLALDTNVLVALHREDAPNHAVCRELIDKLNHEVTPFALFWPSLYEFLRVVTHHRVFDPPTPLALACEAVASFLALPTAQVLSETDNHAQILERVLATSPVEGNLLHDAHLVALALEHGVHELITYDRDFKRFPQLETRTP